jgi:ribonuclease-3
MGGALRFGKGASQNNLRDSENVLADAVEALIAATYLYGGIGSAQAVCRLVLDFGLSALPEAGARDAKSDLQEKVQALGLRAPGYHVVGTRGPAHDAIFEVAVTAQGQTLAQGSGRSKRAAELQAAERALEGDAYKALLVATAEEAVGQ